MSSLDNVKVYDIDSEDEEESFTEILSAKAKITIYEMIRTIIFEIAMYGGPEEKKEKIKEFLEGINAKTMISSLRKSLEKAIENEDYEGAAEFKRIINQLSKK
jgi:protein-arginine kinase activator protein McsA